MNNENLKSVLARLRRLFRPFAILFVLVFVCRELRDWLLATLPEHSTVVHAVVTVLYAPPLVILVIKPIFEEFGIRSTSGAKDKQGAPRTKP